MVFSSSYFLTIFLPLFVIIYSLLPKKTGIKNFFILGSSIFFYSWGGPQFIFIILAATFLDFWFVKFMHNATTKRNKILLFILSLSVNLGLLLYFKYCNFFIDNLNALTHIFGLPAIEIAKILLPIGISFYTFESITYAVDVYRGVHKPLDNFWEYQLYILLFPKLIAGPIVRYIDISDQIKDHVNNETSDNKLSGFIQFCIGLSKKVLIANTMGAQADAIFGLDTASLNTTAAWIGAIAYTFQIYFDFSGYSDMAIGLGKFMGFKLPENFNSPYTASSITEFWRRWHITLGAWMKNYLYIPLGGNKGNAIRTYINLGIVFFVSGLWHGASWNFVFWGVYHGVFLILERSFLLKILNKAGKITGIIYCFIVVVVGWVFFRLENIGNAFNYVKTMFAFNFDPGKNIVTLNDFDYVVFAAILFSFITLSKRIKPLHDRIFYGVLKQHEYILFTLAGIFVYLVCVMYVSASTFNPFIYFRF